MKYLYTIILICLFFSTVSAQNPSIAHAKKIELEYTIEKRIQSFSLAVPKDGIYNVIVRDPIGKKISTPVYKKTFKKGSSVEFSVNTKFWKLGKYRIILEDEKGKAIEIRMIFIGPKKE